MRGCIVKPKGRRKSWGVQVYYGRDPQTRKHIYKWSSFPSRREAQEELHKILAAREQTFTKPSQLTVGAFLTEWLEKAARNRVGETTFTSYQDTVELHLRPELGRHKLTDLHPLHIQEYLATKLQAGLSTTTVRYHVALLHGALRQAVRWGMLTRNPCEQVDFPRRRRQEMQVWDEEQVRVFLAEAKRSSAHYRLYLAALTTGMRQGELLGLRWKDVDLTFGTAAIQQTFYRLGGSKKLGRKAQQLFKQPKTDRGRRVVLLPPVLVEELRTLREEQKARRQLFGSGYADLDLIFCQPDGKPLHAHNVARRDFRRVTGLKALRASLATQGVAEELLPKPLPRIRFHDLRHCHATLLLQQGVHPKVVQERLGHSQISVTLDTYSHVLPGMQAQAVQQFQERLFSDNAKLNG